MPTCWHCRTESPRAHWLRVAENRTALYGPWAGWRMAGRYLIGPAGQRITPERLAGLLWTEQRERRRPSSPAVVFTLPARERFDGLA